ncbi:CATRA system-associated protein [Parafrankia sp. FMc6]|uniref:CATRA system-associated protein n=1 Tax=Parafrankia soli TaxID=2599596 RepID=UPI0034D4F26C
MAISDADRQDALDILRDLHEWEVDAELWRAVAALVARVGAAADADDGAELVTALAELERLSERRGTDARGEEKTKESDKRRDEINDTIHKLGK